MLSATMRNTTLALSSANDRTDQRTVPESAGAVSTAGAAFGAAAASLEDSALVDTSTLDDDAVADCASAAAAAWSASLALNRAWTAYASRRAFISSIAWSAKESRSTGS